MYFCTNRVGTLCRTTPPRDTDLAREVQEYAVQRLPHMEPALAMADAPTAENSPTLDRKSWGMIEID